MWLRIQTGLHKMDQLAIYKHDWGVKLGTTEKNTRWLSEQDLHPWPLDFNPGIVTMWPFCLHSTTMHNTTLHHHYYFHPFCVLFMLSFSAPSCMPILKTWRIALDTELCQLNNGYSSPTSMGTPHFSSHCNQLIISFVWEKPISDFYCWKLDK